MLLGSAALWIFWPSFCSALAPVDKIPLVATNTILALCGATLATYALSTFIRGKMEVCDIANASLAGGVAIGASVANVTPGMSMIIGSVAGAISVIGFTVIQPRLQRLTGGVDTSGVHNLHGMPGVFGGIVVAALVAAPLWQLTGIVITVIFAVIMGVIVGFIVSKFGIRETPYGDKDDFSTPRRIMTKINSAIFQKSCFHPKKSLPGSFPIIFNKKIARYRSGNILGTKFIGTK